MTVILKSWVKLREMPCNEHKTHFQAFPYSTCCGKGSINFFHLHDQDEQKVIDFIHLSL